MDPYIYKNIEKISGASSEEMNDLIAVEKRLRILINGQNVLNLYCTPSMIRELVVGIIHNERLISGEWCADRMSIEYNEEIKVDVPASGTIHHGEPTITSGCVGGISMKGKNRDEFISDDIMFDASSVKTLFHEFQHRSEAYKMTGGVHSAALSDGDKIIAFAEDIGRHNAVDKVLGFCVLENIPFKGTLMMASGRLSSDIVNKCLTCSVPVIVSRTSPTSLAVEIAAASGITLIGFVRGNRMNIYSCRQRVRL
ncbi:MAG: formate dehydrogenase accessory sulfurtransferase FdhD [Nitrospiraceae bacterium]|nr:MAG: formate dehydrogenase accessory sulfurtransferase FdhD [Nitrospiraceae bacterium]